MDQRLDEHTYFSLLAQAASLRSTCPRRQVGAVLVDRGKIVSTGYNGSPPGLAHCEDHGCMLYEDRCIRTVHAEMNALLQAERRGDTLYCTDQPCLTCFHAALNHGVSCIYYVRPYPDERRDMFVEFNGLHRVLRTIAVPRLRLEDLTCLL